MKYNKSSQNTRNGAMIDGVSEQNIIKNNKKIHFEEDIFEQDISKNEGNECKNTLDHSPVLSSDMRIFSSPYEHMEYFNRKGEKKSFLAYFAGAVGIFALSVFGFVSGLPEYNDLQANMMKEESFRSEKDCLFSYLGESTSELEREKRKEYCHKKFENNHNVENYEK